MINFSSYVMVAQAPGLILDNWPNGIIAGIQKIDTPYIAIVRNSNTDADYASRLEIYKIEIPTGVSEQLHLERIDSLYFFDGYYTHTAEYIAATNVWIVVQSKIIASNIRSYRLQLYNDKFELITETSVEAPGSPQTFFIETHNNVTYILCSLFWDGDKILFNKYDHIDPLSLNPLTISDFQPHSVFYITSMRIDTHTGNLLLFSHYGIYVTDPDLTILEEHFHPEILTQDFGDVIRIQDSYYSHGLKDSTSSIPFRNLVIHKYDATFSIQKADTLGKYNHDNFPFIYNSMDYNEDEILVGGQYDGPYSNPNFNQTKKKFYLAKYDKDLNLIWKKEYGGDRAYFMLGLKLFDDQGCFAYGFIYDSLTMERYPYGMYVNKYGELVTSYTEPKKTCHNITIENPGTNTLRLNNPALSKGKISLFDSKGVLHFTAGISTGMNAFNVSTLANGAYYYEVVIDNEGRGAGMWLKVD